MTPVDHIYLDIDTMKLKLSDKAKMLTALIKSFNCKGLMISNSELAELLGCSEDHVSKLLKEISGHIHIENPQSRYRKVFYSGEKNGVTTILLRHFRRLLRRNGRLLRPKQRTKLKELIKLMIIYIVETLKSLDLRNYYCA